LLAGVEQMPLLREQRVVGEAEFLVLGGE